MSGGVKHSNRRKPPMKVSFIQRQGAFARQWLNVHREK
jgi:hypothetical protein